MLFCHFSSRVVDFNANEATVSDIDAKRVPLGEISVNTPLSKSFATATDAGSSGLGLDCLKTPVKIPSCSGIRDSFSVPSILDDDFDESALEEIDALLEQSSSGRSIRPASDSSFHVTNQDHGSYNGDLSADFQSVIGGGSIEAKDLASSLDASESRAELIISDPAMKKIGTMPEEYSKYLLSLNDRQREAACGDISIPLMILAGPGSGKVSLLLSLFVH